MSKEQIIVTIAVAIIGVIGTSMASVFGFLQFWLKRRDEKDEEVLKIMIAKMIAEADDRLRGEFNGGLSEREETGRKRFEINSKAIEENTEQIAKLTELVADQVRKIDVFTDSMTAFSKVLRASAESQRNSNYDRILMVANSILRKQIITITEKTNLEQLYNSWIELDGKDPKITTMYNECMKLTTVPDEE